MLTIRVINPHGSESIFQARHVIVEQPPKCRKRVDFFDEHYEAICVAGLPYVEYGLVYVMNESAKTVATYDLNGEEIAHDVSHGPHGPDAAR
jgi:hypothetical protein